MGIQERPANVNRFDELSKKIARIPDIDLHGSGFPYVGKYLHHQPYKPPDLSVPGVVELDFRAYAYDDLRALPNGGFLTPHDIYVALSGIFEVEYVTIKQCGIQCARVKVLGKSAHEFCNGTVGVFNPPISGVTRTLEVDGLRCFFDFKKKQQKSEDDVPDSNDDADVNSELHRIVEFHTMYIRQSTSGTLEPCSLYSAPMIGAATAPLSISFAWPKNMISISFDTYNSERAVARIDTKGVLWIKYQYESSSLGITYLVLYIFLKSTPIFHRVTNSDSPYNSRGLREKISYVNTSELSLPMKPGLRPGYTISWRSSRSLSRIYPVGWSSAESPFLNHAPVIMVKIQPSPAADLGGLVESLEKKFVVEDLTSSPYNSIVISLTESASAPLDYGNLSFQIAYQLEVLFSNNIFPRICWNTVCSAFLEYAIETHGELVVLKCLEDLFDTEKRYYTVYYELEKMVERIEEDRAHLIRMAKKKYNLPSTCELVRKVCITPTHVYCLPPSVEVSNRILRNYREYADRFIRVSFMDDDFQRLYVPPSDKGKYHNIYASNCPSILSRVYLASSSGFNLIGRHYSLLGFSSGQLRDHSAWFFSKPPDKDITASIIRSRAGYFPKVSVAKYAARLGQCFSTTFRTVALENSQIRIIPDVERNGYVFTDGVGIMSHHLAATVATKLNLGHLCAVPSCFQFRLGGCKGVLSTEMQFKKDETGKYIEDPDHVKDEYIVIRESQRKFPSDLNDLEIVAYSQRSSCFLNRQIVALLLSNGLSETRIMKIAKNSVEKMCGILDTKENLISFIRDVLEPSTFVFSVLMRMAQSSMYVKKEKSLVELLKVIVQHRIQDSKNRARILIENGAQAFGIIDNHGILKENEVFFQQSDGANTKVIVGKVAITRSPCFYRGDLRLMQAVDTDRPQLRNFVDVIVFSSEGPQPAPNMMSGGDLDGDTFFVCWDEYITSRLRNYNPEPFNDPSNPPVSPPDNPLGYSESELASFYCLYICNDNLGVIANTHLVAVDILVDNAVRNPPGRDSVGGIYNDVLNLDGIRSLAHSHSIAVDFPKTAVPAIFNRASAMRNVGLGEKLNVYPNFMNKKDRKSYHSLSTTGKLYDYFSTCQLEIRCTPEGDTYHLLNTQLKVNPDYIEDSIKIAAAYHTDMLLLARKYVLDTEVETFSVVSADVKSGFYNKESKRVGFRSDIRTQLAGEVSRILNIYREAFWEKVFIVHYGVGKFSKSGDEFKGVVRRYCPKAEVVYRDLYEIAFTWYAAVYHPKYSGRVVGDNDFKNPSVRTFPLVIYDVLAELYDSQLPLVESEHVAVGA